MRVLRAVGGALGQLLSAAMAVMAGAALLAGAVVVMASAAGEHVPELDLGDDVPHLDEVIANEALLPSEVFAADGTRIGGFHPEATYDPIRPVDIPPVVVTATLAAEDSEFFDHRGYDLQAIVRAGARNLVAGETVQGGSTISQQLAKNLVTGAEESIERKIRELAVAMELEERHSKYELLGAYLNTSFFGEGAIGVVAAARTYFGKDIDEVTLSEAALLAGILPAPSEWNPRADPERAEARRQYVLDQVLAAGFEPDHVVEEARDDVPEVRPRETEQADHPYFFDYVRRFALGTLGLTMDDLLHGGLRIETTLDRDLQDAAMFAANARLAPDEPSAAIAVLEPDTGFVRALVGGRNWEESRVNLALGADGGGSGRQPGSAFKTFALMAGLARGWQPASVLLAPEEYQPQGADRPVTNATGRGYGAMTLEDATVFSVNTAFMFLTDQIGVQGIADMSRAFGFDLPDYVGPSLAIGTYETTALEMASAYGTIAADGRRVPPSPITRVRDRDGKTVIDLRERGGSQVTDVAVARWTTPLLQQVIQRGTGTRADIGRPAAGKTGTTNDYRDAWFAGYTPQLAAAVWVGYPDSNRPMADVAGFPRVGGGTVPAQIWSDVMRIAHEDLPVRHFPPSPPFFGTPPGVTGADPDGHEGGGEP